MTTGMGGLSVISLLLLIIHLLSITKVTAADQRCFVCTDKSSSKCEGGLSPSDTELIKDCNTSVAPDGCMVYVLQSEPSVYPKVRHVWRDCLYKSDLLNHDMTISVGENKSAFYQRQSNQTRLSDVNQLFEKMNRDRGSAGLPLLQTYKMDYSVSKSGFAAYHHPGTLPQLWNLTNGQGIPAMFPDFYRKPTRRSVSCFVCSHETPGCETALSSSDVNLIKDCRGSPDTTVAIGCQVIMSPYKYPRPTYFYRDCLYEQNQCHNLRIHADNESGEQAKLGKYIECLNKVKSSLGLPPASRPSQGAWEGESLTPTRFLYIFEGSCKQCYCYCFGVWCNADDDRWAAYLLLKTVNDSPSLGNGKDISELSRSSMGLSSSGSVVHVRCSLWRHDWAVAVWAGLIGLLTGTNQHF